MCSLQIILILLRTGCVQECTGAQAGTGVCAWTPGLAPNQCFPIVSADIVLEGQTTGGAEAALRFSVGIKWGKTTCTSSLTHLEFYSKNHEKFEHFLVWNKAIKQQCQNIFSTYSEHLQFLHYKTILIFHKWSLKKEWRSKIIFCKDKCWWNKSEEDKGQTGGWKNARKSSGTGAGVRTTHSTILAICPSLRIRETWKWSHA